MRVVRGGSWNNNRNNARCANRNRNNPDNFNNNQGFRVVLSHIFPNRQKCLLLMGSGRGEKWLSLKPACQDDWQANIQPPRALSKFPARGNFYIG